MLIAGAAQGGPRRPAVGGSAGSGDPRTASGRTERARAAEKQVVFEINAKKKRMRAGAKTSLESATECGKVDAGAAPRQSCLVRWR